MGPIAPITAQRTRARSRIGGIRLGSNLIRDSLRGFRDRAAPQRNAALDGIRTYLVFDDSKPHAGADPTLYPPGFDEFGRGGARGA